MEWLLSRNFCLPLHVGLGLMIYLMKSEATHGKKWRSPHLCFLDNNCWRHSHFEWVHDVYDADVDSTKDIWSIFLTKRDVTVAVVDISTLKDDNVYVSAAVYWTFGLCSLARAGWMTMACSLMVDPFGTYMNSLLICHFLVFLSWTLKSFTM